MVFLEQKMFWKVDKHKRNDQRGIIHPFGKSTKKLNKHKQNDQFKKNTSIWKATKKREYDTDFPAPKIFSNSQKVNIQWLAIPQISLAIPNLLLLHTSTTSTGSPIIYLQLFAHIAV